MYIGKNYYKHGLFLAPLAGIGDHAFRSLCSEFGAEGVCSELISSKAVYYNDKKTRGISMLYDDERPAALQIFGNDPDIMAKAAEKLMEFSPSYIDINMGCPVPKLAKNGDGSALMRDPDLCRRIVEAVKKAVDVPVTAKIRAGYDRQHINAPEVATACEAGGASAVFVHGRTRDQMYSGLADRGVIAAVKKSVGIPVIANGDILCGKDALDMLNETGADGIMVGRGAFGSPWVFAEIISALEGTHYTEPTAEQKRDVVMRQTDTVIADKGDAALLEMRKHLVRYARFFAGSAALRSRINTVSTRDEIFDIINAMFI